MALSDLVAQVDALGLTPYDGRAYRHVSLGIDPRSGVGARIHGGRWNPPESFSTLYLGLSRKTVIAEWIRAAVKQSVAPEDFLPRAFCEFAVELREVLDLRQPEAAAALGLDAHRITADDARACQRVGEAAHYAGGEAVLAPSATTVGDVLVVFLDQLHAGSRVEPTYVETWNEPPSA